MISGIRFVKFIEHVLRCRRTYRPKRFALGAASGFPNSRTISVKTACSLMRTATVARPAVTISGTIPRFGKLS